MPAPITSIHPVPLQTRQPDPSQKTHDTSTSAPGSTNGKKLGRSRVFVFSPKNLLWNRSSVPFRSANVMPSSTTRHSTWWNIGEWVGSNASRRNTRPGQMIRTGGCLFFIVRTPRHDGGDCTDVVFWY